MILIVKSKPNILYEDYKNCCENYSNFVFLKTPLLPFCYFSLSLNKKKSYVLNKKDKYKAVIEWFENNIGNAKSELNFNNNFELLVAVILSAQCTDKRVNSVTPTLFKAFPDAETMSNASVDEIKELISSISYPNSKAQHLSDMSKKLISDFGGIVPNNKEQLMSLPGVGRKTANVMEIVAFGKPAMPVDTHVFRVSNRLGLVKETTPLATEIELTRNIPEKYLGNAHHWLLLHGRYVCTSRAPHCDKCGLVNFCAYTKKNFK